MTDLHAFLWIIVIVVGGVVGFHLLGLIPYIFEALFILFDFLLNREPKKTAEVLEEERRNLQAGLYWDCVQEGEVERAEYEAEKQQRVEAESK